MQLSHNKAHQRISLCVVKVMKTEFPKVTCDHCGELVYRRAVSTENLYKYDLSSKEKWVASVMAIEGVPKEVAESWAEHGLYELCRPKPTPKEKRLMAFANFHTNFEITFLIIAIVGGILYALFN